MLEFDNLQSIFHLSFICDHSKQSSIHGDVMYSVYILYHHNNGPSMISRIITKVRLGFSYTEHTQTMETKINQKLFLYEKKRYTKTLYPSRTIRNLSISVVILKKKKKIETEKRNIPRAVFGFGISVSLPCQLRTVNERA